MSRRSSSCQYSRQKYLATPGAAGVAVIGLTSVIAGHGRDGEQTDIEGMSYSPPSGAPVPGSLYPCVTRLKHGLGKGSEKQLLAAFEYYLPMGDGSRSYFPICRSTDGGKTWLKFSEIHGINGKGQGLRYRPTLSEPPHAVGPQPAGTILAAGNSVPILDDPEDVPEGGVGELGETSINLHISTDYGESQEFVSAVATGSKAVPCDGNNPVWEPGLGLGDDRDLIYYFADRRMGSDDDYSQLVAYEASGDGDQSWSDGQFVVTVPDETTRPGIPTVTPSPSGMYVINYEVIRSDYLYGEVHVKTSPNGREWGNPTDVEILVSATDGRWSINGLYVTQTRAGGEDGTILVSGRQLVDGNRDPAEGDGEAVLVNSNLDGSGDQEAVDAPLSLETEDDLGGRMLVEWTASLLPSYRGDRLLRLASVANDPNLCEINYDVQSLPLDDRTQCHHRNVAENSSFELSPKTGWPVSAATSTVSAALVASSSRSRV